jgi:gliding motility-associated-like protein
MQMALTAGTYKLTITSNTLCSDTQTFTLTQPPPLIVNDSIPLSNGYAVPCHGGQTGSIDLSVNGGFGKRTYNWSPVSGGLIQGDSVQHNLLAGTYSLTVTYGGVCPKNYQYVLNEPLAIQLDSISIKNINCFGGNDGSININASGGIPAYTYLWTSGNIPNPTQLNQVGLTAGHYTIEVTDQANCKFPKTYILSQPDSFVFNFASVPISCTNGSDGSITANVTGGTPGYTYHWSNGYNTYTTQTINGLSVGIYTITVTDSRICQGYGSFTMPSPAPLIVLPSISDYHGHNISCFGANDGMVSLIVSGGRPPYSFLWSNGSTTQNLTNVGAADTLNVVVHDQSGCQGTTQVTLTQPEAMTFSYTTQPVLCYGFLTGKISLSVEGGTAPYTYVWSNGQNMPEIVNIHAGQYSVIIVDVNNCHINQTIEVTQPDSIRGNPEIIKPYCPDATDGEIRLSIDGGVSPYQILWNTNDRSNSLDNIRPGSYIYRITDMNNCIVRDTIHLLPVKPACLDIPNAFSPNNDGANDTWVILAGDPKSPVSVMDMYPKGIFEVYTRWGTLVFRSDPGYPFPWDGTYQGRTLPLDSYYYVFDPRDGGNIVKGIVTIVR